MTLLEAFLNIALLCNDLRTEVILLAFPLKLLRYRPFLVL